jgi:hypothetical protein
MAHWRHPGSANRRGPEKARYVRQCWPSATVCSSAYGNGPADLRAPAAGKRRHLCQWIGAKLAGMPNVRAVRWSVQGQN